MRFIHAADLHLDSPLHGLERYEGAPVSEVRGATRRSFENLIELALREKVDCVLIAGDLYDGDWPDHNTGLFFIKGVSRLAEEGIPVVAVRGNHDAASRITKSLKVPNGVHLLDHRDPETLVFDHLGLAIHGQSFATQAVVNDIAQSYPTPIPHHFNIGLLHTCLDGRVGHQSYAPTTLSVLHGKGYDYWALGHVHTAEIVTRDPYPWVVFPGNTQGRHIRESGAKGCVVVETRGGLITSFQHAPLDVMRWDTINLKARTDIERLLEAFSHQMQASLEKADDRLLALRVVVEGDDKMMPTIESRFHHIEQEIRALALSAAGGQVWIEKVKPSYLPMEKWGKCERQDEHIIEMLRDIEDTFESLRSDPEAKTLFAKEALGLLWQALPWDLRPHLGEWDHPSGFDRILEDAQRWISVHMTEETSES